ncbi:MAG: hypothetical protein AAF483_13020 [Planctomycetota bacterium]
MTQDGNVPADASDDQEWLFELVRCPITHEDLMHAATEMIEQLQCKQRDSKLLNRIGITVEEPFEAGFVNGSQTWFHAVRNGIPTLVPSEAIPLNESAPTT